MEEKKETVVQNIEEGIGSEVEETKPAAENVVDDDIQYTFVVPKGEIYKDPDLEPTDTDVSESEETVPEPVVIEPEPAEEYSLQLCDSQGRDPAEGMRIFGRA